MLPQELIDTIIDYLHDDRTSLSVCSTVCRAWLSPARYHIFRTIYITCTLFRSSEKYHRLLACFDSSPHLATYVQTLEVDHTSWCNGSAEAEAVLVALCSRPHSIKALTLQHICISVLPDHLRESLCSLFALPTLRQLSLIEFNVKNFAELATLLTMCSSLVRLVLSPVHWEDADPDGRWPRQITAPAPPPDPYGCLSLRELKLGGMSYQTGRSLLRFLGESVEDFELDNIFGRHEVDKAADFIALGSMPALRTLRLNHRQSIISNSGAWVVSLLSSLSPKATNPNPNPNRVKRVFIQCKEFHLKSRPVELDWGWYGAVDEVLACETAFPKLRAVDVRVVSTGKKGPRGEEDLKGCFPRLEGRGILRAHFEYRVPGIPV